MMVGIMVMNITGGMIQDVMVMDTMMRSLTAGRLRRSLKALGSENYLATLLAKYEYGIIWI
jgi:hypothetical protein